MRELTQPTNPYHKNPYTADDCWWFDDAWNSETLKFFIDLANRFGDQDEADSEVQQMLSMVGSNVMSNLPRVIPDGEWCVDYLAGVDSSSRRLSDFGTATLDPELSRPTNLYRHLCLRPGEWDSRSYYRNLLLMTADFAEADIRFLFVDGGAKLGMESREALKSSSLDRPNLEVAASSAVRNGALRRGDLAAALANHSLASSAVYLELVDVLIQDLDKPSDIPTSKGNEVLKLVLAAAANPAAPKAVLELLVSGMEYQIQEAAVYYKGGLGQRAPVLSTTAIREVGKFCSAILYHPNWDGRKDDTLALASSVSAAGATRGYGLALPTVADRPYDPSTTGDPESLLRTYAYRSPRDEFVKEQTRSIVAECYDGAPTEGDYRFSDRYYQVGYGVGYYLRLMEETKEAFGEAGAVIPSEWIAELTL